jgi:hypothetical protein
MSFNFNTVGLLENVSKYVENETSRFSSIIEKMQSEHDEKLLKLEKAHQDELDKLIKSHSDELVHLEADCSLLSQVQDLNKFQKKTITELQSSILSLEKRLAVSDVSSFKAESSLKQDQTAQNDETRTENDNSENYIPELYPIALKSGVYYCDSNSNELYEFISEEEAGDVVLTLKTVKIKNTIYYLDTKDNNFYSKNEDNTVGDHAGQVLNKKAIFNVKG